MGWYTPTPVAPDLAEVLVCAWSADAEGRCLLVESTGRHRGLASLDAGVRSVQDRTGTTNGESPA